MNTVNVTVQGSTIQKTGGTGSTWDAGAVSRNALTAGNGYVQATVDSLTTYRMFGLSNGDTDPTHRDIDFAAYLAGPTLKIYEAGADRGAVADLQVGDTVRVAVRQGNVEYYHNDVLVYSSTRRPTYPLLMDSAINSSFGRIVDAFLCGQATGPNNTFTPTPTSVTQTPTGTVTPTYTATPVPPTNTPSPIASPTLVAGCDYVEWANTENVTVTGNTIQKTGGAGSTWDAGAASTGAIVSGDGHVEATVDALNTFRMFGLSNGDSGVSHRDIDFAAYLAGPDLVVYERGANRGTFGRLAVGDVVRVALESGVVRYYLNDALAYTSTQAPTYPLLLDTAINSSLGRIANAYICGGNLGRSSTFTPTPQGTATGTSTTTVVPAQTSTITVTRTPTGTPGAVQTSTHTLTATRTQTPAPPTATGSPISTAGATHTATARPTDTHTNTPTLTRTHTATATPQATATNTPTVTAAATDTPAPPAPECEPVVWRNLVNVTASGNTIEKTSGSNNNWNAGASSNRVIRSGDGYVEATVDSTIHNRMFGLSNGDSGASESDIDFAAYLNGGTLRVVERGATRGSFGGISVGDVIRVAVEGGVVKYYKNGSLVYSSAQQPIYPLLLDASISSRAGRIADAYICAANLGP